jgi:hypothetical protein
MRQMKIIVIAMLAVLGGCASSPGRTSVSQGPSNRPMFEQMPGNFSNPPGAPDAAPTSEPEASP